MSLVFRSDIPLKTKLDFSKDDLETHAWSTQLARGWEAKSSSGTTFKPSVDVADLVKAGIDWDRKHERTLTVDEGCKVVLKE